jgi:hypothetical protein
MERAGFWTRMANWFRGSGLGPANGLPGLGRDGFLQGVDPDPEAAAHPLAPASRLSKQQLREQALERLQDGHLRVVALIESLHKHMENQDRRGASIAGALEQMAGHTAALSDTSRLQTETLGAIATQLQNGNERTQRWEQAFAQFPALAEAQRATLATLSDQLAAGVRADERVGESLQTVRGALDALHRSTSTSTDVLKSVQESAARNQELIGELIQKQRKWLTRLVVVTLAVAVVAVVLAVLALVRR